MYARRLVLCSIQLKIFVTEIDLDARKLILDAIQTKKEHLPLTEIDMRARKLILDEM